MIAKPTRTKILVKSTNELLTLHKNISQDNLNFILSRKTLPTVFQTLDELKIPYTISKPLTVNL